LIGFCPYLRHAHRSADGELAGTRVTSLFTWLFLLLYMYVCVYMYPAR
jgi:hypothetical protein